jgi:hypothetical protein
MYPAVGSLFNIVASHTSAGEVFSALGYSNLRAARLRNGGQKYGKLDDEECWDLDIGFWGLDFGCLRAGTQDPGYKIQVPISKIRNLKSSIQNP